MKIGLPIALALVSLGVALLLLVYFLGHKEEEPPGESVGGSEPGAVSRSVPAMPEQPGSAVAPGRKPVAPVASAPGAKAGSSAALTVGGSIGNDAAASGKGGSPDRPRRDTRISRDAENRMVLKDAIDMSRQLHHEGTDPYEDVSLLDQIVGLHKLVYKTVPGGSENVEVMEVLMGKNERNLVLFPSDHPNLTGEGVLLDRWGTPYFFHNISSEIMDITSAGPDRLLHTPDDVLLGLAEMASEDLGLKPEMPGAEPGVEGAGEAGVKPVVKIPVTGVE